ATRWSRESRRGGLGKAELLHLQQRLRLAVGSDGRDFERETAVLRKPGLTVTVRRSYIQNLSGDSVDGICTGLLRLPLAHQFLQQGVSASDRVKLRRRGRILVPINRARHGRVAQNLEIDLMRVKII